MTRAQLERVLRQALDAMHPSLRVARALPRAPADGVSVIAIGKAAPVMLAGALARWGDRVLEALVVTTDATDGSVATDPRVELLRAAHPVPDARSVVAAERCLAFAQRARGALLVLVSGGASSLVCAPAGDVSLADKQGVTRAMLASGASIQEINVVRKHLSRIKGGGLARAARPRPVLTLAISDVVHGIVSDIGSGPSVGDPSTRAVARRLLRRHAPAYASLPLARTGDAENVVLAKIVAGPEDHARAVAAALRARGLAVRMLPPSQGRVEDLAREYVARARRLAPGSAIVRAAEPSVALPAKAGRGGRATHLAALVGLGLPAGVTFLAAASDGVDGTSGTGGAIVTRRALLRVGEHAARRALAAYATGPLHRRAGTALPMHPSGQNLADLHVLLRARS